MAPSKVSIDVEKNPEITVKTLTHHDLMDLGDGKKPEISVKPLTREVLIDLDDDKKPETIVKGLTHGDLIELDDEKKPEVTVKALAHGDLIDLDDEKKPVITAKALTRDDKGLMCSFNTEVSSDQQPLVPVTTESLEVDIIGCKDTADVRLAEADDPNATECSSSFSGTVSGTDDDSRLSDAEIESKFCVDNGMDSDVFYDGLFRRRKKLTAHWRSYIRPLMWRCKWIELRIKELQSHALAYERELASYGQRKQLEVGNCTLEGSSMRSLPSCGQSCRSKVMNRRKRKRMEDIVYIPTYMSHHNLFSYYEKKRSDADSALMDDECGLEVFPADVNNSGDRDINYACPSGESTDDQNVLEKLLLSIENVHCRVKKLKIQLNGLLTEHGGKFSSMENLNLLVQSDLPTSSARSPTLSPRDGDTKPIGALYTPPRHTSDYDMGEMVVPESAVSSDGEATPPDIIERTMGLLTAAEGLLDQPHIRAHENDEVLIDNKRAEEQLRGIGQISGLPTEKPQEAMKKEEKEITVMPCLPAPKPEPDQDTNIARDESVLKSCLASDFLAPKNKRKRDQRKARVGAWKAGRLSRCRSRGKHDN